jgi:hypothetical protein
MTTTLHLGAETHVVLPVLPKWSLSEPAIESPAPRVEAPGVRSTGDIEPSGWTAERVGRTTVVRWQGASELEFPWGRQHYDERLTFRVADDDPARASLDGEAVTTVAVRGRELLFRGRLRIVGDGDAFHFDYRRELSENGERIREAAWRESIPRDHQ